MTRIKTWIIGGVVAVALFAPAAAPAATINVVAGMGEPLGGDDDQCSLREAITTANGNSAVNNGGAGPDCTVGQPTPNVDTINLPAGTYTLAVTSNEDLNVSGDYDVHTSGGDLVIAGADPANTILDGNDHDRLVNVIGANDFTLTGVTLTDGTTTSGLTGGGGGILIENGGTTELTNVDITNNLATNAQGGGVGTSSNGTQNFTDVTVTGNDSSGTGAPEGGGISFQGGTSTITDSTISGNEVDHAAGSTNGIGIGGGGIAYDSSAVGTIARSTVANNSLDTQNATQFPGGGGIFHSGGASSLTIRESTISGNTVNGGSFRTGGGIDFESSTPTLDQLRIDNSTISGNSVTASANMTGGGINVSSGTIDIANATITSNTADPAGGDGISIGANNQSNGSTFEIRGTILDEGGANECDIRGTNAAYASLGRNIERGPTNDCNFAGTGDQLLTASVINATLASNGGPTQTHANLAAARNVIPSGECLNSAGTAQTADQRGVPRPFPDPGNCDVGAYEYSECLGNSINTVGTDGSDVIDGTAGADIILARGGADTIAPNGGSDVICAGEGDDTFIETADTITDQFLGEGGGDTVSLASVPANPYTVSVNSSGTGNVSGGNLGLDFLNSFEHVIGSAGNDTINGDSTANTLTGGDGDDTIDGQGGDDTVAGGEGGETAGDTMSFASSNVAITFDLSAGSSQNTGNGTDTWSNMENATGGNAADTLRGDIAGNVLNGGFGPAIDDTLEGRAGDDTLNGGSGGSDTVVYDEAGVGVTVDLAAAGAQNTGDGNDSLVSIENAVGSPNNDVLGSSSAGNVFDGGGGNDRVGYTSAAAGVTANLATDTATGDGTDTLTSIENLQGSPNVDTITGDGGINFLLGGGGGDTLTGAGSADTVHAGAGGDSILIRDGVGDTADCGPDVDADTVEADLLGTDVLTSCDGTDTVNFLVPAPPAPTLTGTDPASGANDNNPRVLGNAEAGSTVDLYANATCTGAPVQDDQTAASLASPGLQVTVPDNSTTTFSATATNSGGTSPCSTVTVSYQEVTPADPTPTNPQTPAAPKPKCKKGRKLKKVKGKFKCVKRKRKKK